MKGGFVRLVCMHRKIPGLESGIRKDGSSEGTDAQI